MEEETISLLLLQTHNGGNSSSFEVNTLLMLRTTKHSMSKEEKTMKVKLFGFGENTMVSTKDGQSFIQIRRKLKRQRV
jgi:hypothetical protein